MRALKLTSVVLIIAYVNCENQPIKHQDPLDPVIYPADYCAKIKDNEEFDFVIVGSGPSGSAVARRLAEVSENKVLLLEAGGDPTPVTDIPSKWTTLGPELRWNFQSTRDQKSCLGNQGETCKYLPGKVLGGCSVINAGMYVRGNPQDYEDWKDLGNTGWGYEDVLPYFKKLENFMALPITDEPTTRTNSSDQTRSHCPTRPVRSAPEETPTVSSRYHATGGPININYFPLDPRTQPVRKALFKAFEANGIPHNIDVNGETQIGATTVPGIVNSIGYRQSVTKSYLLNIPDNLKICKHALVHKLEINASKNPKEVTSVKFVYAPSNTRGKTLHVKARKEYILSGGVYNSPGILERSGVGIPKILRAAGIKPIHTLNVGENYQDQYGNYGSLFELDVGTSLAYNPLAIDFTSFTAFVNLTDFENKVPDVQYLSQAYNPTIGLGLMFKPEIRAQLDAAAAKRELLIFADAILRQTKFGSIHITQASNPLLSPKIISNQLSSQKEVEITVKSTQLARKIMSHEALKPFNPKPFILNNCKSFPLNSEKEIMCGVRTLTLVLYHHCGTCYMAPASNPKAVVDPKLRVIGIKNLRVVDTSIMPLVPRGNTEMSAVMVGEKGADLIKEAWGQLGN